MRHRTELRYIQQGGLRQETYEKRKRSLMRKAMELAVMCNSQVALVMFDDKGRLTQFSTAEMDAVLEQYGKAVLEPHERYTPHDMLYGNVWANGFGLGPMAGGAGGTTQGTAPAQSPGDSPASSSEAFQAAAGAQQLLGPLGLAVDAATFPPLSPRSREAYATITSQFDQMIQQQQRFEAMQWQQMQEHRQWQQKQHKKQKPKPARLPQGLQQRRRHADEECEEQEHQHDGKPQLEEPAAPTPQKLPLLLPQQGSPPPQPHTSAAQAALDAALPRPASTVPGSKRVLQPAVARKPKLRVAVSAIGRSGSGGSGAGSLTAASPPEASVTPESHAAAAAAEDGHVLTAAVPLAGVRQACPPAEGPSAATEGPSGTPMETEEDASPQGPGAPVVGAAADLEASGAAEALRAVSGRKRGRGSPVSGGDDGVSA